MDLKESLDALTTIGTLALAGVTWNLAKQTKNAVAEASQARGVWERMAADSARARLDAAAPPVDVSITSRTWPPRASSMGGSFQNDWKASQEWTLPRDAQQQVALEVVVHVKNNGDRMVGLTLGGPFYLLGRSDRKALVLAGGAEVIITFLAVFPVSDWAENWEARESETPDWELPHRAVGEIIVDDMNENGVDDVWNLVVTGAPLRRDPDDAGKWRFRNSPSGGPAEGALSGELSNRRRVYWHSRTSQQEIE